MWAGPKLEPSALSLPRTRASSHETETERLKRQEREVRTRIMAFSASDRLSREDLYTRSKSK